MEEELLMEKRVAAARLRVLIDAYERMKCVSDLPQADAEIEAHQADARRRLSLLEAQIAATEALIADGYPALLHRIVSAEVMADIQKNLSGLDLAFAEFDERMLTTGATLTIGPEIPV